MKRSFLIIFGLLFYTSTITSQMIDIKNDRYWIELGLGKYNSYDFFWGNSVDFSTRLLKGNILYTLRVMNNEEFTLIGTNVTDNFGSIGLLIGTVMSDNYPYVGISGGLGFIGGVMRGKYLYTEPPFNEFDIFEYKHFEKINFFTPSIPLQIDLVLKPYRSFGLCLTLFGDLNFKRLTYGMTFKIGLGKYR